MSLELNFQQYKIYLIKNLENIAGSNPILREDLTGYKNIRKIIVNDENFKALVVRIGHAFISWENI